MQWSKWFIFLNMFFYCKLIISFLELFPATCFLCILQTHQFLQNLKNVNAWLSWWRHQMTTKVTFVIFFMKTYSILSVQYKISCKMDKNALRYMFFHPSPSLEFFWEIFWENTFQKYNKLCVACQIWFNKGHNFRVKLYYTKFSA